MISSLKVAGRRLHATCSRQLYRREEGESEMEEGVGSGGRGVHVNAANVL